MAKENSSTAEVIAEADVGQPVMTGDTIAKLAGMDDAALATTLGYAQQLDDAKAQIKELNALSGKGREYAESRIKDMLTPRIYDLKWTLEEAQRKAKRKDAQTALKDCDCCSVLD